MHDTAVLSIVFESVDWLNVVISYSVTGHHGVWLHSDHFDAIQAVSENVSNISPYSDAVHSPYSVHNDAVLHSVDWQRGSN